MAHGGDATEGFRECFFGVDDPRSGNARRHDLPELLVIALCTVLCGGESCVDMADFAEEKEPFLREFLSLDNGLPSHDTFSCQLEDHPTAPLTPLHSPVAIARNGWSRSIVAGGRNPS